MIKNYDRISAVQYAHKWALKRNPKYLNFDDLGGDCTNFVSQCIFAGSGVMNYTPTYGWYYINGNNKSPSWTGVPYLYNFLTSNKGPGPFAKDVDVSKIQAGDVIQLGFKETGYQHSPFVVYAGSPATLDNILVATHTYDSDNRPLLSYIWKRIRFLHILGVRI